MLGVLPGPRPGPPPLPPPGPRPGPHPGPRPGPRPGPPLRLGHLLPLRGCLALEGLPGGVAAALTGDGAARTGDGIRPGESCKEEPADPGNLGDGRLRRRVGVGVRGGAGIGDPKTDNGGVANLVCAKG